MTAAIRAAPPDTDRDWVDLAPPALAEGRRGFPFGSITETIRMMAVEHDRAGELLAELRAVSYGYEVPTDACASYRSLFERLGALEADIHLHIHKENHLLFPAMIELAVG